MTNLCPHCRLWHDGKVITHCLDKKGWTQAEKDELRARGHAEGIRFAPSSAEMADRFGERNRRDRMTTLNTQEDTA